MTSNLHRAPIWQEVAYLERNFNQLQPIIREGYLSQELQLPLNVDRRGLLVRTEEYLARKRFWVADWIGDLADLKLSDQWSYGRWYLAELLGRLFGASSRDFPGFVVVESCRDRATRQNARTTVAPKGTAIPIELGPNKKTDYSFVAIHVPIDWDYLASKGGQAVHRQELLYQVVQQRTMPCTVGGTWTGLFRSLCAGHPVDDFEVLQAGRIPASSTPDIAKNTVTLSRLICLMRIISQAKSPNVQAYTVEFHPYYGSLLAVRYCEIPLGMMCDMHPRWGQ